MTGGRRAATAEGRAGASWIEALRARVSARPCARGEGRVWAAVACVLVPAGEPHSGPDLLLIERATRAGDPWSGHMGLPGGRWDAADPDALATAVRETHEETGIALAPEHLLGELDDYTPLWRPERDHVVRSFAFALPHRPDITPSDEVARAVWTPIGSLNDCACRTEVEMLGRTLEVDAFRCGPHVVWGMTHRILCDLLGRIF